jgi:hypothetical protein
LPNFGKQDAPMSSSRCNSISLGDGFNSNSSDKTGYQRNNRFQERRPDVPRSQGSHSSSWDQVKSSNPSRNWGEKEAATSASGHKPANTWGTQGETTPSSDDRFPQSWMTEKDTEAGSGWETQGWGAPNNDKKMEHG